MSVLRRLVPFAVLAVLLAPLATGCGADNTIDPVANAAVKTADAGSFRFSYSLAVGIGSGSSSSARVTLTGTGAYDADAKRIEASLALPDSTVGLVVDLGDAPVVYMRLPDDAAGSLPDGKHWAKVDVAQIAKANGVDLGALSTVQVDPRQALEALEQAGKAKKLGEEQIDGVATTHYRVDVDPRAGLDSLKPEERKQAEQALDKAGIKTYAVDVWVGADDLLRRASTDLSGGASELFHLVASIDFTDYGADLHVDLPPASDVAELPAGSLPIS